MKARSSVLVALLLAAVFASSALSQEGGAALSRAEVFVFGSARQGEGMIKRVEALESVLFGRPLPGSVVEREKQLERFVFEGVGDAPPMIFKLGVLEWAVLGRVKVGVPAATRLEELERVLEGKAQPQSPLAARLERLISLALPEEMTWRRSVPVPRGTLVKVRILDTVSSSGSRVGDEFSLELVEDLMVDGNLVAPKGSVVKGRVAEAKRAKGFGQHGSLKLEFEGIHGLLDQVIPIFMGKSAVDKNKAERDLMAALGTSFVGLIALGPIGAVGGLFVRGQEIKIPSGTEFYLEVKEDVVVAGYPAPRVLLDKGVPQPAEGAVDSNPQSGK